MSFTPSPAFRSALTTALVVLGLLVAAAAAPDSGIDPAWVAGLTFAATVLRTSIAWIDKGNPAFGRGSKPPEPPLPPHGQDDVAALDGPGDDGELA